MASAKARRAALRKLLLSGRGGTQADLRDLLREAGHSATQSTVSRDLKLLGAQRRAGVDGEPTYRLRGPSNPAFPADMVVRIEANETAIVIRTHIGRAPAVGLELDALHHPEILGTLSGDDTVLVIPKTVGRTGELANALRELVDLPTPS